MKSFNSARQRFVTLGQYMTVDECMCAWKAVSGEFRVDGIPHQVKITRKPEGVGAEFKSVADPHSGILMHLEIQEGKMPMRLKEYYAEYGAGAACTLRKQARLSCDRHSQPIRVVGPPDGSGLGPSRTIEKVSELPVFGLLNS